METEVKVRPPLYQAPPQNGLAGLKHWRHDVLAALVVALVSVPLSSVTIFVTLLSDLRLGIGAGMLLELFVLIFYAKKAGMKVGSLTKPPIEKSELENNVMDIYLGNTFHCFNSLKTRTILDTIPENVKKAVLHCTPSLGLIDHSTRLYRATLKDDLQRAGKDFEIEGLDQFKSCGPDSTAFLYRLAPAPVVAAQN